MSLWNWLIGSTSGAFDEDVHSTSANQGVGAVNPATGLPMMSGDSLGIDIGGNPFGVDLHSSSVTNTSNDSFGGFDSWPN